MNWLLKKICENPFESLFTFFFFYWEGFILKLKGDDNDLSGENLGGMHSRWGIPAWRTNYATDFFFWQNR